MSTETTSHSTRTDHISLLPNELLGDIFDYAYSSSPPPTLPLSKRLLPFHQKHLYRQITLSSPTQVNKFLTSMSTRNENGKLVKSLEFDRDEDGVIESIEVLENLFPLLPNVEHLELHPYEVDICQRSKILFSTLTNIISVTTEPAYVGEYEGEYINLNSFAFLSTLPSLHTLEIYEWTYNSEIDPAFEETFELPYVKTLRIEGKGAEESTVAILANLCPALLHLKLNCTWEDEINFDWCISQVPASLECLELSSCSSRPNLSPHLFTRFTNLRSVNLDDGCYPKTIHTTLQQLPHLRKVRLGGGAISPNGFLTLFSGPARLVHLETIVLDFYVGERGICVEDLSEDLEMEDWKMPLASVKVSEDEVDNMLPVDELKQVIETAEENGITVEGTIYEALENLQDYVIEKSNRAVLSFYNQGKGSWRSLIIAELDADCTGVSIPRHNLGPLDFNRVELVKTELPERDWFVFSLKKKEEVEL
ncbi:hypothetical protein JCM3765_007555 [Sporobolomyces pararoseus]